MGRKQPYRQYPWEKKAHTEAKKRLRAQAEWEEDTIKQINEGTYEHPLYLLSEGITEKDIIRKVGLETWIDKMDRESEEMMANEEIE